MPEFALRFALIFYGRILFKIITCYTRLALFSLKPFCIHSFSTSVSMSMLVFYEGVAIQKAAQIVSSGGPTVRSIAFE